MVLHVSPRRAWRRNPACYSHRRLLFVLTFLAFVFLGSGVAIRLWNGESDDAPDVLERAMAALTMAFGAWLAIDWALGLTKTLTRPVLIGRTAVILIAGLALLATRRHMLLRNVNVPRVWLVAVVPVLLWTSFAVWRGTVTPPLSHDALSNHLPRAVLYTRVQGFIDLTRISPAFRDMPANYELLLADMIAMLGHDRYTEWVNALCYVLVVLAAGTLASRWWRDIRVTILAMLTMACAPIALLQAGADKNDLLIATFTIAAMVWAGRYLRHGDLASLLLLPVALMIAIGSKPQAATLGAALLPFVAWRAVSDLRARRLGVRHLVLAVAVGIAAFFLIGGYTLVDQYFRPAPAVAASAQQWPVRQSRVIMYGDWRNLWEGPYVLAAAPFQQNPGALYVPGYDAPWFWKRYEIYMSHLGIPFALCLIGAPFAVRAWRKDERRRERLIIGGTALAAFFIQLPVMFKTHGTYLIGLPRYAMFFAAPVIAWSIGALLVALARRTPRAFAMFAAALLVCFGINAVDCAVHDAFAPLDFVMRASREPGTREIPFERFPRATMILDRIAGPGDVVALDVDWASWIQPVFGAQLSRPVYFIKPGSGPPRIPPQVKWVVIERAYNVVWGHPDLKTLADARRLFHRNKPQPEELRVYDALIRDPRFELVWDERGRNQAVFRRRGR